MNSSFTSNGAFAGAADDTQSCIGGTAYAGGLTVAQMYNVTVGGNNAYGGGAEGPGTNTGGTATAGGVGTRPGGVAIYNSTIANNIAIADYEGDDSAATANAGGVDGGGANTTSIYSTIVAYNAAYNYANPSITGAGPDIYGGTSDG